MDLKEGMLDGYPECICLLDTLDLEIASKLLSLAGETNQVDWSVFVLNMSKVIISNYDNTPVRDYEASWKRTFRSIAKALKLKVSRNANREDAWATTITPQLRQHSTSKSSSSGSTSTLAYQRLLEEQDREELQSIHGKLSTKRKLSSGIIVEDVVHTTAKAYTVEQ